MALTFFIVVLIFLACQTGRCVANISDGIIHKKLADCQVYKKDPSFGSPAWNVILHIFAKILLVINRYLFFTNNCIMFSMTLVLIARSIALFMLVCTKALEMPWLPSEERNHL